MFKTYSSSSSLVIISRWFATSRLVAPVSVRLVYRLGECPPLRDQGGVAAGDLAPALTCCAHGTSIEAGMSGEHRSVPPWSGEFTSLVGAACAQSFSCGWAGAIVGAGPQFFNTLTGNSQSVSHKNLNMLTISNAIAAPALAPRFCFSL